MTVSTITRSVQATGDGVGPTIAISFPFVEANDLIVTQRVITTGVEVILAVGTHYTIAGGDYDTGTLTIVDPATDFPSTVTWTIERQTDRTQAVDYIENDSFPAATHEQALDKLTFLSQEASDDADRAMKAPSTDPPGGSLVLPNSVDRASKSLGFDSSGDPIALAGTTAGTVVVTTFMETLLDDVDAPAGRLTLGITGSVITDRGDLIRGDSAGPGDEERLAIGAANTILKSDGTDAAWSADTVPDIAGGDALKIVRVNAGETGLEYVTPAAQADSGWKDLAATLATTSATVAHGLGAAPIMVTYALECVVASEGYSIGDRVANFSSEETTNTVGLTFWWDAINFGFALSDGSVELKLVTKGTTTFTDIVHAQWKPVMRAFA